MRKASLLLLVLSLVALLVAPVAAQDDGMPATIADVVVASATAEEGAEFTTLLTAVQAADPLVLEALSDPEQSLTVFAPTDAAFAALAEALGEEEFNAILEDADALTGILLYHVLDGAAYSEDVVAILEDVESVSLPTLSGQRIVLSQDDMGITIDEAGLVLEMVDIEAGNGVIHVIDAVLLPELRTIAEIVVDSAAAEEGAEFTTLLTAVELADPAVLETLSSEEASLTVFAPTDAAFAALAEALGEEAFNATLEDTEALTDILLYHVADGLTYSTDVADLLEANDGAFELEMANGAFSFITADENGIFIDDAMIVLYDIDAFNGVIHVIDAVIVPMAEEDME